MIYVVTLGDKVYEVDVDVCDAAIVSEKDAPKAAPAAPVPAATAPAAPAAPVSAPAAAAQTVDGETVDSPLPGSVLSIAVTAGQSVKSGQVLLVIEAMKMENEILAPRDCTVKQILVNPGAVVESGAPLVVIG